MTHHAFSPHSRRLTSNARQRLAAVLLSAASATQMTACAHWPPSEANSADPSGCDSGLQPSDSTRLSTIEQMLGDGKFYAALAQLDALGVDAPRAQLIRAEALRRVNRDAEAQAIYTSLQGSCLNGRAQHGLGLIAARAGRQAESLGYLQKARQTLPTDTRVRNDLGYALLLANQFDAARFEFLTVLELAPQDPKATRNLVLLTFRQGQAAQAFELAARLGLDANTTERLQQQAARLDTTSMPDTSPTPPEAR